ncbi:hypothetical protein [Anatilimnocola floriformis]|uniref:hypothetical protein n=1 Tax=Anatilimnocola floriformis TaxID=2948575 RepID=UPI0020C381CD|nr:hypothetical protein [Anatilimnocola floriformis]
MSAAQKFVVLLSVAAALLVGSVWQFAGAQGEKAAAQKWEYRVVRDQSVNGLNAIGDEGWELVNSYVHRDAVQSVFKRAKR